MMVAKEPAGRSVDSPFGSRWTRRRRGHGRLWMGSPTPEEIIRQTIATIIAETLLVESGDLVNSHEQADVAESDIRDAAEAMAAQATLSVDGATEDEISRGVEAGLETIRAIVGCGN